MPKFVVCDLNAIENRVLGWIADCPGIMEVFEKGLDPYISFAVFLYRKPYDQITKDERQVAKSAVLGCGYQLSGGREEETKDGDTIKTGLWGYANQMGVDMSKDQAHEAVAVYRETYPEVVFCWAALQQTAIKVIKTGIPEKYKKVKFRVKKKKMMFIDLPSGRSLHYMTPEIERIKKTYGHESLHTEDQDYRETITHEGTIQGTKKWARIKTYGGRLTENITQAIARDILLHGMLLADQRGFEIVGSSHDEVITHVDETSRNTGLGLSDLRDCMVQSPVWAKDLPLGAEGYESQIYRKG